MNLHMLNIVALERGDTAGYLTADWITQVKSIAVTAVFVFQIFMCLEKHSVSSDSDYINK